MTAFSLAVTSVQENFNVSISVSSTMPLKMCDRNFKHVAFWSFHGFDQEE